MSLLPANDPIYNRTDFVNNRRNQFDDATGTKHISIDGDGGIDIRYDIGTANVKNFRMSNVGVNWTDNTNNNTTSLDRLALVQTLLQAVEIPPNATTLKINNALQINAGSLETADLTEVGLVYTDATGSSSSANWSSIIAASATPNLSAVLSAGDNAGALNISNLNNIDLQSINGSAYPPNILRPVFYDSGSNGFSLSGSWANQGTIYTFQTGLTANTAYVMSVNFSVYTTTYEGDSAMYVDFYNSTTTYPPATYSASRPVAQTGNGATFNSGGTSQFVFNDWVSFTTDSNSQLIMEFYLGSAVSWSGNFYWSMFANILNP